MKLFHSPTALLLFAVAAVLIWCGVGWKKGHILSFFGGLCFALGSVAALVDGVTMQEILLVAMALFFVSQRQRRHEK